MFDQTTNSTNSNVSSKEESISNKKEFVFPKHTHTISSSAIISGLLSSNDDRENQKNPLDLCVRPDPDNTHTHSI